jgi:hypothetical protein
MLRELLAFVGLPSLTLAAALAAELPPPSQWIPEEAAIVIEVHQPMTLLEPLLSPEVARAVTNLASGSKPNLKLQQLQGLVAYLELQLGTDWRTAIRQLAGNGFSVSFGAHSAALLTVDAQEAKLLNQLNEVVRKFAAAEAAKHEHPERVAATDYRGVTTWTFGTNEAHAIVDHRLLLANRPQILTRVLDLRAEPRGPSIAASSAYQAARQAVGKEAVASAYFNLEMLRELPAVKKALADDANPAGVLLLADTKEALRHGTWLALGVYLESNVLKLKLYTDGEAPAGSKAAGFATPHNPEDGLLPNLTVAGTIASVSLYRDLQGFYAAKDALFGERTSGLVFFENMMGIFFSGIELTDGVLGEARPDLRIVVAEQKYDPAIGTPEVQVPAFAAVLRLRHGPAFGEVVEEAWQKAIGLANFTRGQKALPGLVIDRDTHAGVKYTVSAYRPPSGKEKGSVDMRYNFRPSLARPGDYLVISSTDGLAQDLIDALQKETSAKVKGVTTAHTVTEIDGDRLRGILAANREHLIRKNMVEKGNSREQAESDIRGLLALLSCLDEATLVMRRQEGRPSAELDLRLQAPAMP